MTRTASLLLALSALAVSCGGGGDSSSSGPMEIVLHGNDQMKYLPISGGNSLTYNVEQGKEIKVTLKNIGSMPLSAMGHNFVVLQQGEKATAFGVDCLKEGGTVENGYLPEKLLPRTIAHTKLLGPGEEDSVTFTFDKPGVYEYVCTYQGHAATMKGKFAVK